MFASLYRIVEARENRKQKQTPRDTIQGKGVGGLIASLWSVHCPFCIDCLVDMDAVLSALEYPQV